MSMMRCALPLVVALVLAVPVGAPAQSAGTSFPRDSATALIEAFLARWRRAWQASEVHRHPVAMHPRAVPPGYLGDPRVQRLHCHGDHPVQAVQIAGAARMRFCPGFPPPGETLPGDERLDADAALYPEQRDTVRQARAGLIDALAQLAVAAPADDWLHGQRVRFAMDQGDTSAARALVRRCEAAGWWCALLDAWVEHRVGDASAAEARFDAALAAMPAAERCRWTDVGELLPDRDARERYRALPCERRADV
jgi:hypothetical protein